MNPQFLQKLRVFANRISQKSVSWATISSNSNPPIPILISRRTLTARIQSLNSPKLGLLSAPWSATQLRPKYCGSDVRPGNVIERKGRIYQVRPGNVIERKGRIYQVVKALHRTPGKGGALIQVELRDVDSGNKVNERLRTDEAIEIHRSEPTSPDMLMSNVLKENERKSSYMFLD